MGVLAKIIAAALSLASGLMGWARERRLRQAGRDEAEAAAARGEADARQRQQEAAAELVGEVFGPDGAERLAERVRRDEF